MSGNIKLIFVILFVAISMGVKAESLTYEQAVQQLNQLLAEKNYQKAYELADEQTFEHGGLPEFDILAGFAAFGSEHYQEAAFAFERVALEQSDSFLARFYLAQTYQKMNNLAAAINELDTLLTQLLSDDQRERADSLRSRYESLLAAKNQRWGHSLSVGVVYDTNVNSGTSEQSTYFRNPLQQNQVFQVLLTEGSRKSDDWGYNLNYSGFYQYQINQNQKARADVSIAHFGFKELDQYRRNPLNLSFTFEQTLESGRVNGTAYTRPLLIEGQDYRTENGLSTLWQYNLSKNASLISALSYSEVKKDQVDDQDFNRTRLAATYTFVNQFIHGITAHWYQDVSENSLYEYNDKDVLGLMYQVSMPLGSNTLLSNFIMVEQHKFQAAHPWATDQNNTAITRDETLTTVTSQLSYKTSEHTSVKFHLTLQGKSSNLPLFSFNRAELGASWNYQL